MQNLKKERLTEQRKNIVNMSPQDIEAVLDVGAELTNEEISFLRKKYTSNKESSKILFSLEFPPKLYEILTGNTHEEKLRAISQDKHTKYLIGESKNKFKSILDYPYVLC